MSTPAVRVCQPGYDVNTCPDYAYLFNSDWPNLAIAYEETITSGGVASIPHKLGFPPLTMGWLTDTVSYGRLPGTSVEVDKQNVYIFQAGQITVRSYNIDISKEASYPLPQSANAKLPYNNQFGAKLAKNGRLITSSNLNDFILHTRAQSPAVLDVATQAGQYYQVSSDLWPYESGAQELIVYPLQTSYLPWNTGAFNLGNDTFALASGSEIYFDEANNQLILNISATGAGSLVVLRDPLFYPNTVRVVY